MNAAGAAGGRVLASRRGGFQRRPDSHGLPRRTVSRHAILRAHSQAIVAHHGHRIAGQSRRPDDWMLDNAGPIVDLPR